MTRQHLAIAVVSASWKDRFFYPTGSLKQLVPFLYATVIGIAIAVGYALQFLSTLPRMGGSHLL